MKKAPLYDILHEDEHHLVINKSAGIGCIPDRRDEGRGSLLESLQGKYPSVTFVHRLDFSTSGVVLAALHKDSMRFLSMQFENREIKKEYLAYIAMSLPQDEMIIEKPVGPYVFPKGTTRRKGKKAKTHFVKHTSFRTHSKILCYPETGKTHQIRIHLADLGRPILADSNYGGEFPYLSKIKKNYHSSKRRESKEKPLINRAALHAYTLEYTAFGTTERVKRCAPESSDLVRLSRDLDKYDR